MIIVCGLNAAQMQIDEHGAQSVISILGPETPHRDFNSIERARHLRLTFNDINAVTPGLTAARSSDARQLVDFISAWDRKSPLLIHCWAGISRSTASAFTALCVLRPDEDEFTLAEELREASPSATPNRMITAQVDKVLDRKGRMNAAIESIGRGADAFEGKPFKLLL